MYRDSGYNVMEWQQPAEDRLEKHDTDCAAAALYASVSGRQQSFDTLVSPAYFADTLGIGLAINAQSMQNQTVAARASGLLATAGPVTAADPSVGSIESSAPNVVPLNTPSFTCPVAQKRTVAKVGPIAPGMPHRAPHIVFGPDGPMYYRGADGTYTGAADSLVPNSGLTGYSPSWSDAWVMPSTGPAAPNPINIVGWLGIAAAVGLGLVAMAGGCR